MSSLTVPSAATSTLPGANIHPHGHGHKKGALPDPFTDDSSSSTAAPAPAGTTQNLFGSLFNSLQQLIGARPAAVAKPAASLSNAAPGSTAVGAAAAGTKINLMA